MSLAIEPVDPHDETAYDAFYDVYLAAERAEGSTASPWMREEMRASLQERAWRWRNDGFVGRLDGRVVAAGLVAMPLLDNLDTAQVEAYVAPDDRRRGYGSAMLAGLERVAGDRGRTVLQSESSWPYDGGPEGAGAAGAEFARAHGYALGLA